MIYEDKDNPGFLKQDIHLPADDFDEDDAEDELMANIERRIKNKVERSGFYGI